MEQFFSGEPIPGPFDIRAGDKVVGQVTDVKIEWSPDPSNPPVFFSSPNFTAPLTFFITRDTPYVIALRAEIDRLQGSTRGALRRRAKRLQRFLSRALSGG